MITLLYYDENTRIIRESTITVPGGPIGTGAADEDGEGGSGEGGGSIVIIAAVVVIVVIIVAIVCIKKCKSGGKIEQTP